jgi:PKD repeat protein
MPLVAVVLLLFFAGTLVSADEQPSVSLSKVPLSFIMNMGQADPGVAFTAGGSGYSIVFAPDKAYLVSEGALGPTAFTFGLEGQDPSVVEGQGLLPGIANFIIGDDPLKWYQNVPMYGAIVYRDALPGVDQVYKGTEGVLKREFIVAPGISPSGIVMKYEGISSLRLNPDGSLTVTTPSGSLTEQAPFSYQVSGGNQVPVSSSYVILDTNRVGFLVGPYDVSRELVIDPSLVYGSYLGGDNEDSGTGIAIDAYGNAYLTGYTQSSNFPTRNWTSIGGCSGSTCNGLRDAFITKIGYNGTWSDIVYSTYYGGNNDDQGLAIAVDGTGSPYVTGKTASLNFPISGNPYQGTLRGGYDAFVLKLNASGQINSIPPSYGDSYSTFLGGADHDQGLGIKVDSGGNAYITGDTYSNNFPTYPVGQAFQQLKGNDPTPSQFKDAFLTKLDPTGSSLVYSTYLGGTGDDQGRAIALDYETNAYITGYTKSGDYPLKNQYQPIIHGFTDAFLTKMNTTGFPIYSTYLGGYAEDWGQAIDVNPQGEPYITGKTTSVDFPITAGVFQPTKCNHDVSIPDAFVTKFNCDGSLSGGGAYSTYLGGIQSDSGNGIAVDGSGYSYVTGATNSNEFCQGWRNPWIWKVNLTDGFLVKINPTGTYYTFATPFGGCCNDEANAIALDSEGSAYITGFTESYDFFGMFPGGARGGFQQTYGGNPRDAFIIKVGTAAPTAQITANSTGGCMPVIVNFTDLSSGGLPTYWSWNFDDGNTTTFTTLNYQSFIVHTFPNVTRTYNVRLTVTNSDGSSTATWPVTVCDSPVPNFTASNLTPVLGQTLTFTDNTPGTNVAWDWVIATDSGSLSRSGQSVQVNINSSFYTIGTPYWVNLTVTNACGCSNSTNISAFFTPRNVDMNATLFFNTTTNRTVAGRPLMGTFHLSQADAGVASYNVYSWFTTSGIGQFGSSVYDQINAPIWFPPYYGPTYFSYVPNLPSEYVNFTGIDGSDYISYGHGRVPFGSINVTNSSAVSGTVATVILDMEYAPGSRTEVRGDNGVAYTLTRVPVQFEFYNYPPLASFPTGAPGTNIPWDTDGDGYIDDVDGNGKFELYDVYLFFNYLPTIQANWPVGMLDYNGDGVITVYDVYLHYNHYLGLWP